MMAVCAAHINVPDAIPVVSGSRPYNPNSCAISTGYAPIPPGVTFASRVTRSTDVVHAFFVDAGDMKRRLTTLRTAIRPDAAVWVSWPKKASRVATDISEDTIRAIAMPLGFVDVKVCAVNEVWSGLKLVVRKELRHGLG